MTMALVCEGTGKYNEALQYKEKLLDDLKANPLPDYVTLGKAYNNIAGVYRNLGNLQKAMANYEEALRIKEKFVGKNTFTAANTCYNLS